MISIVPCLISTGLRLRRYHAATVPSSKLLLVAVEPQPQQPAVVLLPEPDALRLSGLERRQHRYDLVASCLLDISSSKRELALARSLSLSCVCRYSIYLHIECCCSMIQASNTAREREIDLSHDRSCACANSIVALALSLFIELSSYRLPSDPHLAAGQLELDLRSRYHAVALHG